MITLSRTNQTSRLDRAAAALRVLAERQEEPRERIDLSAFDGAPRNGYLRQTAATRRPAYELEL